MDILINGQPELVSVDAGSSLQQTLHQLRDWVRREGLAILTIDLDGRIVTVDLPAELAGATVDAYQRMDVKVARPRDLATGVLEGLRAMLGKIETRLDDASSAFSRGEHAAGMAVLPEVFEGWSAILASIGQVSSLCGISPEAVAKAVPTDAAGKLGELIGRARQSMDAADFVALGDILEYELGPAGDEWSRYLGALIALVRATGPASDRDE